MLTADDSRWEDRLRQAPETDVFYSREYARFRNEALLDSCVMLSYEDELGMVFDVTELKQVSRLDFYHSLPEPGPRPSIDLASPEYNGPVLVAAGGDRAELLARYRRALDAYCQEKGIVTEFVRLHPLSGAAPLLGALEPLISSSEVVYVDVSGGHEAARAGYRPEHRAAIRRAVRSGASVHFVTPDDDAIGRFVALHAETLGRKADVKSYYRRTRPFFEALFRRMGDAALLVESRTPQGLASAAICLAGPRNVWYLYGGTRPEAIAGGANKLLFDQLVAWCAANSKATLVLCGGFAPGDGLYQFKRGFSRLSAPVPHLRKIHDPARLQQLLAAKAAFDEGLGRPTRLDYFPSYWLD